MKPLLPLLTTLCLCAVSASAAEPTATPNHRLRTWTIDVNDRPFTVAMQAISAVQIVSLPAFPLDAAEKPTPQAVPTPARGGVPGVLPDTTPSFDPASQEGAKESDSAVPVLWTGVLIETTSGRGFFFYAEDGDVSSLSKRQNTSDPDADMNRFLQLYGADELTRLFVTTGAESPAAAATQFFREQTTTPDAFNSSKNSGPAPVRAVSAENLISVEVGSVANVKRIHENVMQAWVGEVPTANVTVRGGESDN